MMRVLNRPIVANSSYEYCIGCGICIVCSPDISSFLFKYMFLKIMFKFLILPYLAAGQINNWPFNPAGNLTCNLKNAEQENHQKNYFKA